MSTLLIEGGRKLSGRITVDGNKNSALPLVAACLLSEEPCRLENVPRISDIRVMADLLTGVGARVSGLGTPTLEIAAPRVTSDTPDPTLVGRLRGSVLLMGPLLARTGRVRLAPPGGDFPTRRTIANGRRCRSTCVTFSCRISVPKCSACFRIANIRSGPMMPSR